MPKRILQSLLIGLGASALALLLWHAGWLDRLEARTWDWRVSALCRHERPSGEIALVFLDQKSLDWGSRTNHLPWPWPRQVYAPIINVAKDSGARAVVFDVLFTEPSREGVEDDEALAAAIGAASNFVGALYLGPENSSATNWPSDFPPPATRADSLPQPLLHAAGLVAPAALFPIPEIATNSLLLANVFSNPDPDGIYRRVRLFQVFDGRIIPSLGLGAYLATLPEKERTISVKDGAMAAGRARVPLDRNGYALLRYRGPSQTHPTINAAAAIQTALKAQQGKASADSLAFFKDRCVFFGFTAPGLYDLRSSPVSAVYPGVEVHATALDNLLANDFMRDAPQGMTVALVLILACVSGILTRICRSAWQTVASFVVLLPLPALAGFWAYGSGLWLPIVVPLAAVAPALVGGLVLNYATEGRQKRFIKNAFKQYLSPTVIDQLVQHPEKLQLGGELRDLSIYFSDVQGFTSISEKMTPEKLTALLNEYLTAMTEIIYEEGGTVDKYEGDAIIAFWNAPISVPDHAPRAARAALRCQARLAEMRPAFRERIGQDMYMRIGVNSGPVVIGNMGSNQRFNYTFLGDAGNLASRLEGINKQFGTYILISQSTRDQLGAGFAVREIGKVRVVGRKEPVVVFEPMLPEAAESRRPTLDAFARALSAFYAGRFTEALELFGAIADKDPAAARYVIHTRLRIEQAPENWDGVISMTEK